MGSAPGADATCALRVESTARSFSYVPVRKRQVEAAEQAAQARAAPQHEAPQARVRYEGIGQFGQKVELYRGRWAAGTGERPGKRALRVGARGCGGEPAAR
jgi:hypothetical protein